MNERWFRVRVVAEMAVVTFASVDVISSPTLPLTMPGRVAIVLGLVAASFAVGLGWTRMSMPTTCNPSRRTYVLLCGVLFVIVFALHLFVPRDVYGVIAAGGVIATFPALVALEIQNVRSGGELFAATLR